ncbi:MULTISPECIES: HlyD family secretion protein [unclassified Ensifer]|uniref:HlyD family secretion protein n=1 Tax=unclassified Ensifer TaxID=2633371 RepID=UPI000714CF8C|nr:MULTISPECIES: HlyD family secretion protein [unclassified Ensifer]KQX24782.1 multidrug transporter [Ensifer sp. Root423]KQZ52859.1 multidrug transporter [Ensifer sp. Root558]MBD9544158.1 HlyD family secretion protein [Ensifer sp. ENS04]SFH18065.1 membrane fusion protein, multidrug efflux system [Ensifer sp. OV372]
MDTIEDRIATATGSASSGAAEKRSSKRKKIGMLLCLGAAVAIAGGWAWARPGDQVSTDNAYVRGDVTSLAPKIAGYVVAVEVQDNQSVRAGDVLFRIDDRDYRARFAQAAANVEAAKARLVNVDAETELQHALIRQAEAQKLSAVAEMNLAAKAYERRRELIRSNTISQAHVDESDAARSKTQAGVSAASATIEAQKQRIAVLAAQREAAVAAVAQAEAARDLSQIDLESTVVRAPVGGVIGNRQVRVGRFVVPGTSLLDIVPVDDVWVVANFKETQLEHIQPGQRVRIRIDGYPGQVLEGTVDSFAPGSGSAFSLLPSDNATGNFVRVVQRVPVKIRFARSPLTGRLVPGLSARVDVDLGRGS